jgi:hypothetical protein
MNKALVTNWVNLNSLLIDKRDEWCKRILNGEDASVAEEVLAYLKASKNPYEAVNHIAIFWDVGHVAIRKCAHQTFQALAGAYFSQYTAQTPNNDFLKEAMLADNPVALGLLLGQVDDPIRTSWRIEVERGRGVTKGSLETACVSMWASKCYTYLLAMEEVQPIEEANQEELELILTYLYSSDFLAYLLLASDMQQRVSTFFENHPALRQASVTRYRECEESALKLVLEAAEYACLNLASEHFIKRVYNKDCVDSKHEEKVVDQLTLFLQEMACALEEPALMHKMVQHAQPKGMHPLMQHWLHVTEANLLRVGNEVAPQKRRAVL